MSWDNDPLVKTAAPAAAPWDADPVVDRRKQPRVAKGLSEAWQAGYQGSLPGLVDRGKLPDIVVDRERSTFLEQLTSTASQMINEMPESILGAVVGGMAAAPTGPIGSMVGAGAGGMALPTALRESYIQALEKGQVADAGDFFSRAKIVFKKTGIDAAIGGMLGPAQLIASRGVGKAIAPMIGESIAVPTATKAITGAGIGAEVSLMAAAPALLHEGRLPDWQDFANAGVLVAGMRVASGVGTKAGERVKEGYAKALNDAPEIGRKLGQIYAKTGIRPEQVVADVKVDPVLAAELRGETVKPEPTRANADMEAGAKLETKPDPFAEYGSEIPTRYREMARDTAVYDALRGDGAELRMAELLDNMEGRVTAGKEPNHINYRYTESPDEVLGIHAKVSEIYQAQIEAARGTEKWAETAEKARQMLRDRSLSDSPDFSKLAAQDMAWSAMMQRAAFDLSEAAAQVRQMGAAATPEMLQRQVVAAENLVYFQSIQQANGAGIARALAARKAAKETAALAKEVSDLYSQYGTDAQKFARLVGEAQDAHQVAKAAEALTKPTWMERYTTLIKAFLTSGPHTHMVNLLGTGAFVAARPLIDVAAVAGGKVHYSEPVVRVIGNMHAMYDSLIIGAEFAKDYGYRIAKSEKKGSAFMDVLRDMEARNSSIVSTTERKGPDADSRASNFARFELLARSASFTPLKIVDAMFQNIIRQGEINALAAREAGAKSNSFWSPEYRQEMARLMDNPTAEMIKKADAAALRLSFNADLGKKGQSIQGVLDAIPSMKLVIPFVRTPANVFKELFRMTPFSPLINTWRADFMEGGAARHKAIAEVFIGSLLAGWVFSQIQEKGEKFITGGLDPDPAKKNIQLAAGMKPYHITIGGTAYEYQRIQPIGTLLGLAADMTYAWKYYSAKERDRAVAVLVHGFSQSVVNQTFLQGTVNVMRAITEPGRYGERLVQQLVGMNVPALLAQNAALLDDHVREINSIWDAVKNRLPFMRETLLPQRDPFGEPVANPERVLGVSPIRSTNLSTDPVRTEAARLGVAAERTPKAIDLPTKIGDKKLGRVELTPEQRDIFGDVAGKKAYEILSPIVGSPAWQASNPIAQKKAYERAFEAARKVGRWEALTPEQRAIEFHRIQTEITYRLYQAGPAVE